MAQVQTDLRRRIPSAFVGRGLIGQADAKEMLACQHSGFSVDAGVCIEAHDRAALERLLRYCARPPFAMCCRRRGSRPVSKLPRQSPNWKRLNSCRWGHTKRSVYQPPMRRASCR